MMSSRFSRRERQDLRRRGFRPVTIWVPNPAQPGFKQEAERQALAVSASDRASGIMQWIESISAFDEDAAR
jgi:hypothetical protein